MRSALELMDLVPVGENSCILSEKIACPGGCSTGALLELERQGIR
jgi:pyrroline-5-carboxylate reductase